MVDQYKYAYVVYSNYEFVEALNKLGANGWRVVSFEIDEWDRYRVLLENKYAT